MKLLVLIVTGAAALLFVVWLGQRRLLYFPDRDVPAPRDVGLTSIEDARFTADDGVALRGWFAPGWDPSRHLAVLVCHGNGGNVAGRTYLLRDLPRAGLDVLVFDYRGYGASADVAPTEDGLSRDGRAALAWLRQRTGEPLSRVVLYGESLGTGVVVELARELAPDAPAALVLQSPFTSVAAVAAVHYPWLPSFLLRDRFDNLAKIGAVRAPLLVLHGTRDSIVPIEQGRALLAAAPGRKQMVEVPGRDHNDLWSDERARTDDVVKFLDEVAGAK